MPTMIEVVGMGMGTVFVGLICIVVLISIMNWIFSFVKPKENKKPENTLPLHSSENAELSGEEIAAVSATIAEVLGRDVSGIKITSIKKIN